MNQMNLASQSPYPGLRPFSGDEAIYYCGRESHVEVICDLLRQNKFLMVAGASGDGKSSLVFAGLVPAMQAGFFKAQHSEFRVASFRPERSPMENFAAALAPVLGESDVRSLQTRLSYGYSSLVEIFREAIQDEAEGYNLVLYADQFEELFTYPENYRDGKCSAEAQLLVNLLLETSRIALEQNLPVYVVCTMRSDYIGQCSSFRGLAEYIGFSHYFVPRLNRLELRRVIEEPAMLNGDEITPRLVERLLYDLEEGNDQLPVLQHALSRIWMLAGESGQAMDLMHYAKAGGMGVDELPEKDQEEFKVWLNGQPEELKPIFAKPGLGNVLNLHAEGLLNQAIELCRHQNIGGEKYDEVPGAIFRCLTQVDRSRLVRNQISAEELLQVLEIPGLQLEQLSQITGVFRKPGNTFLRPFISENSSDLKPESVLDITHESLIRNWDKLGAWTEEEENDKQVFFDFDKQLNQWLEHSKSADYLLPIGPLTQYESWFEKKRPNAGWLAGLNQEEESRKDKTSKARLHLELATEFIRKSSRRLLLTRTVMKYGANRILLLAGSLVVAFSCLYYYLEYRYKQNEAVVERVLEEGKDLMANPNVSKMQKARFAILWERHHGENAFVPLLDSLHNDTLAFDIGLEMYEEISDPNVWYQQNSNLASQAHPLAFSLCTHLDKIGHRLAGKGNLKETNAKRISQLVLMAAAVHHVSGKEQYRKMAEDASGLLLDKFLLPAVLDTQQKNTHPAVFFQSMLEVLYLNKNIESLRQIYSQLSPGRVRFNQFFPDGQDFDAGTGGRIPRLGGTLLLQFLAERCGARKQADSLTRINQLHLQNLPLQDEIIRHSFCIGLVSGRKWSADQLNFNADKMAEMLFELRKISNPKISTSIFFPSSIMLKWSDKRKTIDQLSQAAVDPFYGKDPFMGPLIHKARCIWFESYGLSKEAGQEAAQSIALLKKLVPAEASKSAMVLSEEQVRNLFFKVQKHYQLQEASGQKLEFLANSQIITWGSDKWNVAFIQSGLAGRFVQFPPARQFLGNYLADKICGDSLELTNARNQIQLLFNLADENPGIIKYDSLTALHCLYDLKKDFSYDAVDIQNSEKSSAADKAKFVEIRKVAASVKEPGLLPDLAHWLARRGCIQEAITLLERMPLTERRESVADIVLEMNESGSYAEFMPALLDKAFDAEEENHHFPSRLFSAISSTGGLRFIQFAFGLLREQEESKKPGGLHLFIEGLCKVGQLQQAKSYIPNESSSDGKMRLLNVILEHEDSPSLQGKDWDKIHFPFNRGMYILDFGSGKMEVEII